MNILLIGEYYSHNLGDPLLCRTVEKAIMLEYPDATIIPFDISGKLDYDIWFDLNSRTFLERCKCKVLDTVSKRLLNNPFFNVYSENRTRYLSALCSLNRILEERHFDLAIFAGGSIFMDYFAGIIYAVVSCLNRKGIKVLFHACGMGPIKERDVFLLQKTFNKNNVVSISLRDSLERFNQLFCVNIPVYETFDTALGCSQYYPISGEKTSKIGICIIGRKSHYIYQKNFIHYLMNSSHPWMLYTNGNGSDHQAAIRILQELGITENIDRYLAPRPTNDVELVNTVTCFSSILSYRMHSSIIAASFGIPHLGFVIDDKVKTFYDKIGIPENGVYLEQVSDYEHLISLVDADFERITPIISRQAKQSQKCLLVSIKEWIGNDT